MDLGLIASLSRAELVAHIEAVGIDGGSTDELDTENLQGLLLSFVSSCDHFDEIYELSRLFQQPFELVQSLLESNDWRLTSGLAEQLIELSPEKKDSIVSIELSVSEGGKLQCSIPDKIAAGSALLFVQPEGSPQEVGSVSKVTFGSPPLSGICSTSPGMPFGMYRIRVQDSTGSTCCESTILASSALYEYGHALDAMGDVIHWGWEGQWSEMLEGSLLELLVSIDDDLVNLLQSMRSMMAMINQSAAQDISDMTNSIKRDVQEALCDRSAFALGRLHEALRQILDMSEGSAGGMAGLISMPPAFSSAVHSFIRAKLEATPQESLQKCIHKLIKSAREYRSCNLSPHDALKVNSLLSALSRPERPDNADDASTPLCLPSEVPLSYEEFRAVCAATPSQLDAMRAAPGPGALPTFTYMPQISFECISNKSSLASMVQFHSECLYNDVMQVGSLLGYKIEPHNMSDSCAILTRMLDCGLGYVASKTDKLMGLLPLNRSMILLTPTIAAAEQGIPETLNGIPKTLLKRSKDMHRIFRNKVKQQLALRLNSDLDTAIALLKAHHGEDCWIGPQLEKAWRLMTRTTPPMLMVFELWYGDSMIAADFCHPVNGGLSVYVATRFFIRNSDIRHIQPGFLLALAECQYLRASGCQVWDLGGVNLCPLMRYKYDLAGAPIERPQAQFILSSAWAQSTPDGMSTMRNGSLIEDLGVTDLLGATL